MRTGNFRWGPLSRDEQVEMTGQGGEGLIYTGGRGGLATQATFTTDFLIYLFSQTGFVCNSSYPEITL